MSWGCGDGAHSVLREWAFSRKGHQGDRVQITSSRCFSHLEIFLPDLKLDSCVCVLISEANYLKFLNLLDRIFIKTEKIDGTLF